MRFGHTAFEFGRVASQIVSGGIPDFSKFNVVDHVKSSLEIEHISVAEITAEIQYIIPGAFSQSVISELNSLKDENGHAYTVHLPLWSIELATFNAPIRKGGVQTVVDMINLLPVI